ncbi:hypothetical protein OKW76_07000 [Sphingomonas sp. S1-29]|uniref:hypothetical protein n=1 Tax=Sphingomonas sp. S1-29 TaxID=2991074 RepID=UPI00223EF241|nr:hypothetical protein [Sphingomonas sp. S1-29]UZK70762.1 hypothetical protein OKW76_07000 [Sphingomonas sp. S1-29]
MAAFVAPMAANAQAFGVKLGGNIRDYKTTEPEPGQHIVQPPLPHARMELYFAMAADDGTVCAVTGVGNTIRSDLSGVETRKEFSYWRDALVRRYGQPSDDFDWLDKDASTEEKNDFRKALKSEKRVLDTFWIKADGANLPSSVTNIRLQMTAGDDGSYVAIRYEGADYDTCQASYFRKRDTGL